MCGVEVWIGGNRSFKLRLQTKLFVRGCCWNLREECNVDKGRLMLRE